MKKYFAILLALFFFSITLSAQTITYSLDTLKRDSFFLVEQITWAATIENPKPATQVNYQVFRSREQLVGFILYLRDQSAKSRTKAAELKKQASDYELAANKLIYSASEIEKLNAQNEAFFTGKKPPDSENLKEIPKKPSKKRKN